MLSVCPCPAALLFQTKMRGVFVFLRKLFTKQLQKFTSCVIINMPLLEQTSEQPKSLDFLDCLR
nr:MAG TPA: hypothetical protein [Caudoviricetes sp.]